MLVEELTGEVGPETYTKIQATQHGCLPSLLGAMRTKRLKQCTVRKKISCTGPTREAKAVQKSLAPALRA